MPYRVAVVEWSDHDGIAKAIHDELIELGHQPVCFRFDDVIPSGIDVLFSFAPYGRLLPLLCQSASMPRQERPTIVHWSFESPPDPRIPRPLVSMIGGCRSWIDRLNDSHSVLVRALVSKAPLSIINKRMHSFRRVGEYLYAYRRRWLDVLADTSKIFARLYERHGLPAIYVPWGTSRNWYAELNLDRDIDVLWMGKRRTKRRSRLLDRLRSQLSAHGIQMYVADNTENPFIFGEVRTRFLNRAKICLNLLHRPHSHGFSMRFHIVAGNRCLVVSEPFLPHFSRYEEGKHYVSAPVERLAETIQYYLEHEDERLRIAENAHQLVTTELTFGNSIRAIMTAVDSVRCAS